MSVLDDLLNCRVAIDEFLEEQSENVLQTRMFARVSDDIDKSEGSYIWDSIVPTSFEFALAYIAFRYGLNMAFPQHSFGKHLSLHAEAHGAPRRLAQAATGHITITGLPNTAIPSGTKFSTTVAEGSTDAPRYYSTTAGATISSSGTVEIPIEADISGAVGNVREGEVNLNIQKLTGITKVSNETAIEGGIDEEKDTILLPRMLERVQNPPSSGNVADYKRWAKEVPGVGEVSVKPLWAGPGTVKVIIVALDGQPADSYLIDNVQKHIDPEPRAHGGGCAPIGATVTVDTVISVAINITIPNLILDSGYELPSVEKDVIAALTVYFAAILVGSIIRVKEVEAVINSVSGVLDFNDVLLSGASCNISLQDEEKPVVGKVVVA